METYTAANGKEVEKCLEIRFLDSLGFTLKSLEKLTETLEKFPILEAEMGINPLPKKKGVFPYDYFDSFEKLSETSLLSKEKFYSKLNSKHIDESEYEHAKLVWKEFDCKTIRDYHNIYLKTDVILLADIMENQRKICIENYKLDPLWYYSGPGLAWDSALRKSKVNLELLSDPTIFLMFEKGIRGGTSIIPKRYAKASNKYMKNYNPKEESSSITYLDANNLCNESYRFNRFVIQK